MKRKLDLGQMFPFYVALAGTFLTLLMFVVLLNLSGWKGAGHLAMLLFALLGGGAAGLLLLGWRQWAALLLIVSGMGAFFSFMMAYTQDPSLMGTQYPLVLFAIAPLCISGVWVAVEQVTDEDEVPAPQAEKPSRKS